MAQIDAGKIVLLAMQRSFVWEDDHITKLIDSLLRGFPIGASLPPLDGGRVAVGLLPGPLAWQLSRVEPYGFFILLGLMAFGVLWFIIQPFTNFMTGLVHMVVGL